MKKESNLFTKVNFIEVIRTIPWKNITALSVLFYIAAIWDFFIQSLPVNLTSLVK